MLARRAVSFTKAVAVPGPGNYAEAVVPNPVSALVDFPLLIDLSNLPQDWWNAVTSSDPTTGRVFKGDGETELPADWIEFDDTAQTGRVWVRWTGTLAASGTQNLQIIPPTNGTPGYAPGDPYGSQAVWVGHSVVFLGTSLTETNRRGIPNISTSPDGAGHVLGSDPVWGPYVQYNNNNRLLLDDDPIWTINFGTDDFTIELILRPDLLAGWQGVFGLSETAYFIIYGHSVVTGGGWTVADGVAMGTGNSEWRTNDNVLTIGQFAHLTLTYDASGGLGNQVEMYVNGIDEDNSFVKQTNEVVNPETIYLGGSGYSGEFFPGSIGSFRFTNRVIRPNAWVNHDYSQMSNNAAFWGTWTWN